MPALDRLEALVAELDGLLHSHFTDLRRVLGGSTLQRLTTRLAEAEIDLRGLQREKYFE